MFATLETQRLMLRVPIESDFMSYRSFFQDSDLSWFYGGPLSEQDTWKQLAQDIGHWHLKGYGMWSIVRKSDNRMIGGCGYWWPDGWPRPELSWWLTGEGQGCGYASEASAVVIDFGYDQLHWQQVETHIKDDNLAALKLLERLRGSVIAREKFPDGIVRNVYHIPRQGI